MAHTIINEEYDKQICSIGFSVLRCSENVYSKYLWYSLFANTLLSQYEKLMMGASYPALNNNQIQNLLILLPFKNNQSDLEKQKEIADYLDNLHNKIKQLEELQELQLEKFNKFKESILNKAFRGELV